MTTRTFTGALGLGFRIVVPEAFLEDLRLQAKNSEATAFLKRAQELHPTNDDAFVALILSNGLRMKVGYTIQELMLQSGLGGTVSPATIDVIPVPADFNSDVQVQVVEVESTQRENRASPVFAMPYGEGQLEVADASA